MTVKHILELTPVRLTATAALYSKLNLSKIIGAAVYNEVIYSVGGITEGDYSLVEVRGDIGWISSMWLEKVT